MSSAFSLRFVSFLQNYPNLLLRRLRRLFMSARLPLQLSEAFRHRDGTHGSTLASRPPSRAQQGCCQVRCARSLHPRRTASDKPYTHSGLLLGSPTTSTAIVARRPKAVRHGDVSNLSQSQYSQYYWAAIDLPKRLMDSMHYPSSADWDRAIRSAPRERGSLLNVLPEHRPPRDPVLHTVRARLRGLVCQPSKQWSGKGQEAIRP
jgi:hypothetical protein